MNKLKKMLPYLLVCALAFYVAPLLATDTGGFIFVLLLAVPAICLTASLIYGILNGFAPLQLLFPLFVGVLFVPSIYIFYNESAWVYAIAYGVISLIGNGIGYGIAMLLKRG